MHVLPATKGRLQEQSAAAGSSPWICSAVCPGAKPPDPLRVPVATWGSTWYRGVVRKSATPSLLAVIVVFVFTNPGADQQAQARQRDGMPEVEELADFRHKLRSQPEL